MGNACLCGVPKAYVVNTLTGEVQEVGLAGPSRQETFLQTVVKSKCKEKQVLPDDLFLQQAAKGGSTIGQWRMFEEAK
jgi:hypothetical protein